MDQGENGKEMGGTLKAFLANLMGVARKTALVYFKTWRRGSEGREKEENSGSVSSPRKKLKGLGKSCADWGQGRQKEPKGRIGVPPN